MTSPDTADLAGKGGLILDAQGASRCFWQPSMPDYHDHECCLLYTSPSPRD